MKYVLPRNMAAAGIVYGSPERAQGDVAVYTVPLIAPVTLAAQFALQNGHAQADITQQQAFQTLQAACLEALVQNRVLFKHPPSLASLETITPNWGCVYKGTRVEWSPYMLFDTSEVETMLSVSHVQLVLKALRISRSSIQPVWCVKKVVGPPQIEIDWAGGGAEFATLELEEVSDIPAVAEPFSADFCLRNLVREKIQAKERVRAAYRAADVLAGTFYEAYDVSDTESAFSEWENRTEDEADDSSGR